MRFQVENGNCVAVAQGQWHSHSSEGLRLAWFKKRGKQYELQGFFLVRTKKVDRRAMHSGNLVERKPGDLFVKLLTPGAVPPKRLMRKIITLLSKEHDYVN